MAKAKDSIMVTPVIRVYTASGVTEHSPRRLGEVYRHPETLAEDTLAEAEKKRLRAEARRNRKSQQPPKQFCR